MRAVTFALSLLVLGSFAAAAQEARPMLTEKVPERVRDAAIMGTGALLGFLVAEPLGVTGLVGAVAGFTITTWWYADHLEAAQQRPEISLTVGKELFPDHETSALVLRPISRNF